MKPDGLFGRQREWSELEDFVTSAARGTRVGVLYGRRRLGKSFMLRHLVAEHGGLYHMALEEDPTPALQRFADTVGAARGLGPGQLRFADWQEAIETAFAGPTRLLVIDELPYLLARQPGAAIPSVLQAVVDESRTATSAPARRVIVCGSALSVMDGLLVGQQPLRGRVELSQRLAPFGFRDTAAFYGITDPAVAFRLYATLGGTPGYRDLLVDASPQTHTELDELLLHSACNPSHALFNEPQYLLREDPRITDRALYYSIVSAIAAGASTPTKIATLLGRQATALAHPMHVLTSAGFVRKDDDVLKQRRPHLRVADPIVRFHDLVIAPRLSSFEDRRTVAAWEDAQETLRSQLYGPAFEDLAREWVRHHASEETCGGAVGEVGSTVVNDAANRARAEVDVVAVAAGRRRHAHNATIRVLGEAKDSDRPRGLRDLHRLDRVRSLMASQGVDVGQARLMVFGRSGFDDDLTAAAADRSDVELVDLERVRHGD